MNGNLHELTEQIIRLADYVVKEACERTTSGQYYIDIQKSREAVGMSAGDFDKYQDLFTVEMLSRDEVLDFDYSEDGREFDINCGLNYCPNYEWCEGDEETFGCSYEEWLERPVMPVTQKWETFKEKVKVNTDLPDLCFIVRDGNGNDVRDRYYSEFEPAVKALRQFVAQESARADGAMLGIFLRKEDQTYRCALSQYNFNRDTYVSMDKNISERALALPEIELAALRAKQLQYPFDEKTQARIDGLEKQLGIFDRDTDTSKDLYMGKWRVHMVAPGAHYGLHNSLTNDGNRSMVEFWDMSQDMKKFPEGQFVSRYFVETLLEDKWGPGPEELMRGGLCLDGLNADAWSVTGNEMKAVFAWLQKRELLSGEHYLEYHMDIDVHCSHEYVGKRLLFQKLNSIPLVRDVKDLECIGQSVNEKDGKGFGFSVSFDTQANKDAVEKAFRQVFDGYHYELACEEKVVEVEREPLDKVIKRWATKYAQNSKN